MSNLTTLLEYQDDRFSIRVTEEGATDPELNREEPRYCVKHNLSPCQAMRGLSYVQACLIFNTLLAEAVAIKSIAFNDNPISKEQFAALVNLHIQVDAEYLTDLSTKTQSKEEGSLPICPP